MNDNVHYHSLRVLARTDVFGRAFYEWWTIRSKLRASTSNEAVTRPSDGKPAIETNVSGTAKW
jgi:hypothetical protein